MGSLDDGERIEPATLAELGAWLAEHHQRSVGAWIVLPRRASPRWSPDLTASAVVPELLRFGWIDSLPRKLDEERTMLYVAPRKPGSNWSALNKRHVAELEQAGRMEPSGRAVVEAAKADGSWSALDEVERLVVPDDLRLAFDRFPGSLVRWEEFPPSSRRGILEWIHNAKRASTRSKRVEETARLAAEGKRANQWPPER